MMTAESMLPKRSVLKITVVLFFLETFCIKTADKSNNDALKFVFNYKNNISMFRMVIAICR